MSNKTYPSCDEGSAKFGIGMRRGTVHTLRFPESFSRTSPLHDADPLSDASVDMTPPNEMESYMFPIRDAMDISDDRSPSPPLRSSRSSVMKLENILNDVSIGCTSHSRSRSLYESPTQSDAPFESVMFPLKMTRSVSPVERVVKKKKVKMHKCPECHKEFPRPSGLRTHMNMHTKEKPFACTYPGCKRSFSVVSNAKRHMRTHGVGVRIEDRSSESPSAVPYVVGFEAPVIVSSAETDIKEPLKLRWVAPASSSTAGSSGSGTSSGTSSSRARSLSGARDAAGDGLGVVDGVYYDFSSTGSESHSELDSPRWRGRECFSNPSSPPPPRSHSDFRVAADDRKLYFGQRLRVESERSTRSAGGRYLESTNCPRTD